MNEETFPIPTDTEISDAEQKLNFTFPAEYVAFLKSGSGVGEAALEPATILPSDNYLDIFALAEGAWNEEDIPRDWLPFIEDNSDYYLLSSSGEVRFWSHNGPTDESWPTFSAWFQQVCIEEAED